MTSGHRTRTSMLSALFGLAADSSAHRAKPCPKLGDDRAQRVEFRGDLAEALLACRLLLVQRGARRDQALDLVARQRAVAHHEGPAQLLKFMPRHLLHTTHTSERAFDVRRLSRHRGLQPSTVPMWTIDPPKSGYDAQRTSEPPHRVSGRGHGPERPGWNGKTHPAAELFPYLPQPELVELADDITANGLHEPILFGPDGTLLDGRNRLSACELAGVQPRFDVYDGNDPVAVIVSRNLRRRHLTTGQRAALAVDLLPMYEGQAKQRQGARTDLQAQTHRPASPVTAADAEMAGS